MRWSHITGEKSSPEDYPSVRWDCALSSWWTQLDPGPGHSSVQIKKKRVEAITKTKEDVDEKRTYVKGNNNETPDLFQVVNMKKTTKEAGEFRLKVGEVGEMFRQVPREK